MSYLGGCGWDLPAAVIEIQDGRQVTKTRSYGGVRSSASVKSHELIELSGRSYGLVELACDVGRDTLSGYHLVAWQTSGPVDLGLIAGNDGPISVKPKADEISVSYRYQTTYDSNAARSGRTSYRVAIVGATPIRLYGEDETSDVGPDVADLEPRAWSRGLVAVSGYVYEESQTSWTLGVLTEPDQTQLPWALGAPQSECWIPTVFTQAGERVSYEKMMFTNGPREQSGTIMTLSKRSAAPVGKTRSTTTPIDRARRGLLVEGQGRVPALATARPERTEFAADETVVLSGSPTDEMLFAFWFEVNQDPDESRGPTAAFVSPSGAVAMMGSWSHIPFSEGQVAGYGMVGMPDASGRGDLEC